MKKYHLITIVGILLLFKGFVFGQGVDTESNVLYEVETLSGKIYTGVILDINNQYLSLELLEDGILKLKSSNIRRVLKLEEGKNNNVNEAKKRNESISFKPDKYFVLGSARHIGKGNYYLTNTMLLYNQFSYGLTHHLTLSGSLFLFSGGGPGIEPLSASIKYSRSIFSDNINIDGGMRVSHLIGLNGYDNIVTFFGDLTIGSASNNFTLGFDERYGSIKIGGMLKLSKSTSLIFDVFVFDSDNPFSIVGARTKIRRVYLDYGVLFGIDGDEFELGENLIPILSVKIPFSRN